MRSREVEQEESAEAAQISIERVWREEAFQRKIKVLAEIQHRKAGHPLPAHQVAAITKAVQIVKGKVAWNEKVVMQRRKCDRQVGAQLQKDIARSATRIP